MPSANACPGRRRNLGHPRRHGCGQYFGRSIHSTGRGFSGSCPCPTKGCRDQHLEPRPHVRADRRHRHAAGRRCTGLCAMPARRTEPRGPGRAPQRRTGGRGWDTPTKSCAEAADRAKTVFLADMSHEPRPPLNAVIGIAEFLAREHSGPLTAKQKERVRHPRLGTASARADRGHPGHDPARDRQDGSARRNPRRRSHRADLRLAHPSARSRSASPFWETSRATFRTCAATKPVSARSC